MLIRLYSPKKSGLLSLGSAVTGILIACVKMKFSTVSQIVSRILPLYIVRVSQLDQSCIHGLLTFPVCDLDKVPDFNQMYGLYKPNNAESVEV